MIFEKESKKMERWKSKNIIIASKRLLLVPLEKTDAEEVLRWTNNQEIVKNFQFFTGNVDMAEELRYIGRMRKSPTDLLLGVLADGEELIGSAGLHEIDFKNHTARLGIIIGKKEQWNQGYAGEAIRALLDWAFSVAGLHKVYLNVFVTNEIGFRLYTKIGFQEEGTLRREYKIRGGYVDMLRMAILKEEWKNGN